MLTQPCVRASEAVSLRGACEPSSLRACVRVRVGSAWVTLSLPGPPLARRRPAARLTTSCRPRAAYHTHGLTCAARLAGASLTVTLTLP